METTNIRDNLVTIILWNRKREALFLGELFTTALPMIERDFELERVGANGDLHFVKREMGKELPTTWMYSGQGEGTA